ILGRMPSKAPKSGDSMIFRRLCLSAFLAFVALIGAFVTDAHQAGAQDLNISAPPTIVLPVGSSFTQGLTVSDGTPPYTWTLLSARNWVTLTGSGSNTMLLSLAPTESGNFSITLSVRDSTAPEPRTRTLTIPVVVSTASAPFTITTP